MHRLLRGHYSPFIAPTDSFANPMRLSSTSAIASLEESLQVATSPCCRQDLPDDISANPSSDVWSPSTAVPRGAFACFYPRVIGLLHVYMDRLPASSLANDFTRGGSFRACRHFVMFKPPSLLASHVVPTAAYSAGQPRLLRPGRTCFVASARTGYANRPNTGN